MLEVKPAVYHLAVFFFCHGFFEQNLFRQEMMIRVSRRCIGMKCACKGRMNW